MNCKLIFVKRDWLTWRNLQKWSLATWQEVYLSSLSHKMLKPFPSWLLIASIVSCWCCSNVYLFSIVHEICMDGTATQLSTFCLSCLEWDCSTLSILSMGKGRGVSSLHISETKLLCFYSILLFAALCNHKCYFNLYLLCIPLVFF